MKPTIALVLASLAMICSSGPSIARSSTEGIVVYSPIDGVTVVTVTEAESDLAVPAAGEVNVSNEIVVIVTDRRFHRSHRCGIGVLYPWRRASCGDPLYTPY
jgi:hypothetical protein